MPRIKWSESVWFFDVDDTLVDTAGTTFDASEGIRKVFTQRFDEKIARNIQEQFNLVFQTMLAGLRNKSEEDWAESEVKKTAFEALWKQVSDYQQEIKQKYGAIKKFSREVFIKICVDRLEITVAPEIIYEAANAYWTMLAEKTELFPGVLDLVKEIKKHQRPICLVTSSDGRLKLKPNGQFEYLPKYSENFKRVRLQLLKEKGIIFDILSIGDPEDKPNVEFFEKGIKETETHLGTSLDLSNAIIIGDSYQADLQTPKEKMGFGLVVLFQQGKESTDMVDERQIITGDISEVLRFLI